MLLLAAAFCLGAVLPAQAAWRPGLAERSFDIQLSVPLNLVRPADILALDLFTTPPERTAALRAHGVAIVCHVSAGRWQNWRPDAKSLSDTALGRSPSGWPGERWFDIRHPALRPVLEQRLDLCRDHGFDGVLLADLDGYTKVSGFPLTPADQLAFNLWLADAAHRRGLAVGLVDNLGQAGELADRFDFLVASDCLVAGDCAAALAFSRAGKPVYLVAYTNVVRHMDLLCTEAAALGISLIFKTRTMNGKLHRRCP
jgi:Glycoside-hydrolase family GH114